MDKALYGHPKAGDIWAEGLGKALKEMSFLPVDGWPSVFAKDLPNNGVMMVKAYVDYLLFLGTEGMQEEIKKLRTKIKMDDPATLSKYLGCNHRFSKEKSGEAVVTKVEWSITSAMLVKSTAMRQACHLSRLTVPTHPTFRLVS